MNTLTATQVYEEGGLEDWRVVLGSLHSSFRCDGMAQGLEFAARIGAAADAANHHPDLGIRYFRVMVELVTHDAGGLTTKDVEMARTISGIAAELELAAEPEVPQVTEIAIDALDIDAVRPFWEAVTGYEEQPDGSLADVPNRQPPIWFQQMDAERGQRNRIHLDINVPVDVAEARLAAALDAGGTLLSSERAPAFWVLADPEGNEACICTAAGRD